MSDNEGPSTITQPAPSAISGENTSRRTPVADPLQNGHDNCKDSQYGGAKEWESFERASRRPSFLDNLADSRDSQFHVEDRGEIERYFVREDHEAPDKVLRPCLAK